MVILHQRRAVHTSHLEICQGVERSEWKSSNDELKLQQIKMLDLIESAIIHYI